MSTDKHVLLDTVPASADLSTKQYFVCTWSTGRLAVQTRAGAGGYVLQDKPNAAGIAGTICLFGRTKVVYGGTVTAGASLASDNAGRAVAAADGDVVIGTAAMDGASGDIGAMWAPGQATSTAPAS